MRGRGRKGGGHQVELEIERLGRQGDGVARYRDQPVFVPLTLPGDRIIARIRAEKSGGWRGEALELLHAGPWRTEPPCPHFGPCGGCALQHLSPLIYPEWKRGLLVEALRRQGLPTDAVAALTLVPAGTRRRAVLAARRRQRDGPVILGFHGRASHEIVDLQSCLILRPSLVALLAPLRDLLGELLPPGERADVVLTESESGADILLSWRQAPPWTAREMLVDFAKAHAVARISWASGHNQAPELLYRDSLPQVTFGPVAVTVPPGGFLQPSREGEAALVEAVLAGVPATAQRVADLFGGCGTFTFPLVARGHRLLSVEGDAMALDALWTAARDAALVGRVAVEQRDLDVRPLSAEELAIFDAVVFDPPRQGARAQAEQMAASKVPRIVAVSCNPVSFARDARILSEGGYHLTGVRPIDQFPWTAHVELVATFDRHRGGGHA